MSKLFQVILFFSIYPCWGQSDTITVFYDQDWNRVSSLKIASYYGKIYENENGHWVATDFYLNGDVQMTGVYLDSTLQIKQGSFVWFYKNGQKKTIASYWNNYLVGEHFIYYSNGQIDTYQFYDNFGQLKESKFYKQDGSESIMEEALFQGKSHMLLGEFFQKNITYPRYARKRNIQGKVFIRIELNERGIIENFKVVSSPDESLSKEALRVVKLMLDWTPARRDGEPVPMALNIPISFILD